MEKEIKLVTEKNISAWILEIVVAILFSLPMLIALTCFLLSCPKAFPPLTLASGGICVLLCMSYIIYTFFKKGRIAFSGFRLSLLIFLAALLFRLIWDGHISPKPLFYSANSYKFLAEFVLRILLPTVFFTIFFSKDISKNAFRLFFIFLVLECILVFFNSIHFVTETPYVTFSRIRVPSIPLSQMGCCLALCSLWYWNCKKLNVWLFLVLIFLGNYTMLSTGKRGPVLAYILTLILLYIFSVIRSKRRNWMALCYLILVFSICFAFTGNKFLTRLTKLHNEISMFSDINEEFMNDTLALDIKIKENECSSEPEEKKPEEKKPEEKKPEEKKSEEKKSEEKKSEGKKSEGKKPEGKKPEGKKSEEKTSEVEEKISISENVDLVKSEPEQQKPLKEKTNLWQKITRDSEDARVQTFAQTIQRIIQSPWIGSKPGVVVKKNKPRKGEPAEIIRYPHNSILEAFMLTGIFGGCLFLWIVFQGCRDSFYVMKHASGSGIFAILFLFYFIQSLTSYSLYTNSRMWLALAAVFAVAGYYRKYGIEDENETSIPDVQAEPSQ